MAKSSDTTQPVPHLTEQQVSDLEQWMQDNTVHFAFKGINSNINGGGVRVGLEAMLTDLPYISMRTLMSEGLHFDVDYVCAARFGGPQLKKTADLLGDLPNSDGVNQQTHGVRFAQKYAQIQTSANEIGANNPISPRMRQILIPKDGEYISLSPLGSAGLNKEIFSAVNAYNKEISNAKNSPVLKETALAKVKRTLSVAHGSFTVGGSNPQNIGRHIREGFTSPLIFPSSPDIQDDVRIAFKVHHQGFQPKIFRSFIEKYVVFHQKHHQLLANLNPLNPNAAHWYAIKEQEKSILLSIIEDWGRQAKQVLDVLQKHRQLLPEEKIFSNAEQEFEFEQWTNKYLRDQKWEQEKIDIIIKNLNGFVKSQDEHGNQSVMFLSENDKQRIRKSLQGEML